MNLSTKQKPDLDTYLRLAVRALPDTGWSIKFP